MIRKSRNSGGLRRPTANRTRTSQAKSTKNKSAKQAKSSAAQKQSIQQPEDSFEQPQSSNERGRFSRGSNAAGRVRGGGRRRSIRTKGGFLKRLLGIGPRQAPQPRPNPNNNIAPQPPANNNVAPQPPANNNVAPQPPANNNVAPQPPANNNVVPPGNATEDILSGSEILSGWKQGSTGNCVTVAAIKAAQTRFGPELANTQDTNRGVFKAATRTDNGGLKIEMRDGFKCALTKKELDYAKKSARFRLYKSDDKALLTNAQEIYAIAAKRAQIQGNDGIGPNRMSYSKACNTLNNGENTQSVREQLGRVGLEDHTKRVSRNDLKEYAAGLTYTPGHAYFVTEGKRDYYGKSGNLGRGGKYAWVLTPQNTVPQEE